VYVGLPSDYFVWIESPKVEAVCSSETLVIYLKLHVVVQPRRLKSTTSPSWNHKSRKMTKSTSCYWRILKRWRHWCVNRNFFKTKQPYRPTRSRSYWLYVTISSSNEEKGIDSLCQSRLCCQRGTARDHGARHSFVSTLVAFRRQQLRRAMYRFVTMNSSLGKRRAAPRLNDCCPLNAHCCLLGFNFIDCVLCEECLSEVL
jgi:hypothetical protein